MNQVRMNHSMKSLVLVTAADTDYSEADLIDGIGAAGPAEIASWMMGPRTRILSI